MPQGGSRLVMPTPLSICRMGRRMALAAAPIDHRSQGKPVAAHVRSIIRRPLAILTAEPPPTREYNCGLPPLLDTWHGQRPL